MSVTQPSKHPNPFDDYAGLIAHDPLMRLAAVMALHAAKNASTVPQLLLAPIYRVLKEYREKGPEIFIEPNADGTYPASLDELTARTPPAAPKEVSMLEHDTLILDENGQPYLSYSPRKMEPGSDTSVISCTPDEAEFWGVYAHPFHDVRASHMADAHDRDGARLLALTMWQSRQTRLALDDLMTQLKGIGIANEGSDHGQWAGTEGLDFNRANRAIAQANIPIEQTFTEHGKGAPVDITGRLFEQEETKNGKD